MEAEVEGKYEKVSKCFPLSLRSYRVVIRCLASCVKTFPLGASKPKSA
jgi:hypothetical protein